MCAVRLPESVAARDQRDDFLVVHRHPAERLADVLRRRNRIAVGVRTFGVHVNEPHLHRGERPFQLALLVPAVAIGLEPLLLGAPIDRIRLPRVRTAAAEAQGLEAHLLERNIARQHHEVAPREPAAILLLDRPEQAPRLVEIGVVRPRIERLEALLAARTAAAPVDRAIGARAVPGHADEERAIVAIVRRPPRLRRRQHLRDIRLHRLQIEAEERLRIVEVRAIRARQRVLVLPQRREIELVGPPVLVGGRLLGSGGRRGRGRIGGMDGHRSGCQKRNGEGRKRSAHGCFLSARSIRAGANAARIEARAILPDTARVCDQVARASGRNRRASAFWRRAPLRGQLICPLTMIEPVDHPANNRDDWPALAALRNCGRFRGATY